MLLVSEGSKDKDKLKKKKIIKGKFKSRRDAIIDGIPYALREIWFGFDEDKEKAFANWLIEQDELHAETLLVETNSGDTIKKNIDKLKPANNADEVIFNIRKMFKIIKKNKSKKIGNVDKGIVRILNPDRYSKKYLDVSEYRKELKKLAKREKEELKEIERLGYGTNEDVKRFIKKTEKDDELTRVSLSDSYCQKYPLPID